MAIDWMQASAVANGVMALMTGLLAVVTWLQAKQLAYKDLVLHYHEMASKVYPVLEKNLKKFSEASNVLLGHSTVYASRGQVSDWWPALKISEPGLVHHLPKALQKRLEQFQTLAVQSDQQRDATWDAAWQALKSQCESVRRRIGVQPEMPTLEVHPSGSEDRPSMHALWAQGESIKEWLERTAEHRDGGPSELRITVAGKVVAERMAAHQLVDDALKAVAEHPGLRKAKETAEEAASVAREALKLLEQDARRTPQRRWLWPAIRN